MNILITGGAGFIGSHLAEALLKKHRVSVIDNLTGGDIRNLPKSRKLIFYEADCRNKNEVEKIFRKEKPEIVYHAAADATEGRSQFTPISSTENNILASVNVFKSAIKHGVKRIVFISSMSIYGKQKTPFTEDMESMPVDVYGVNKAACEKILEILSKVHNVEYVILRLHNVFGERQNIKDAYRNVIGIMMNRIMQGKPPVIYGDGKQVRSFTYIDNITPCIVAAMDCRTEEIINLGPTETQTINQAAKLILKAFDSKLIPEHVPDRPREVKYAHCSADKAIRLLGYKTLVSFPQGVNRMAQWARSVGPQPFIYLDDLEIMNDKIPKTWTKRLM